MKINHFTLVDLKTDDNKTFRIPVDSQGQFFSEDEIIDLYLDLEETVNIIPDIDYKEFRKTNNIEKSIEHYYYNLKKTNNNKYEFPIDVLNIKLKEFNLDKNKWSFKCANCSNKINEDIQLDYYSITPVEHNPIFDYNQIKSQRTCSKACAKVVAEDVALSGTNPDYVEYIDWVNTEKQIAERLKQIS